MVRARLLSAHLSPPQLAPCSSPKPSPAASVAARSSTRRCRNTSSSRFSKRRSARLPAATCSRGASTCSPARRSRNSWARSARSSARSRWAKAREYNVYPPNLHDPYRSRRFKCGEDLYATLGIPREDKPARIRHFARNYELFGAPVAMFFSTRSPHGPGPVGRRRHVHAEHHAARTRARPAHVRAGSLGGLVQERRGISAAAGGPHALLRHGARLHGRAVAGKQAAHRACAACRVCDVTRSSRI